MKPLFLYVHIPFCKAKCAYCDFLSFPERDNFFERYVKTLIEHIKAFSVDYKDYTVKTVFIGGGTPSILPPEYICSIIEAIYKYYNIDINPEITIEANPESAQYEKLLSYKQIGINRISFGAQSFDDAVLCRIGRVHNTQMIYNSFESAVKAGFNNINLDLIYALPGQSIGSFTQTLKSAVELNPQHISCYGLIIEEGTPFYNDKSFDPLDESAELNMYRMAKRYLTDKGYKQYEISNYSKPGYESRHNLCYWCNGEYIGFGLGAHSYINGTRFCNTESLEEYLNSDFSKKDLQELSIEDKYAEFMFLGMRKISGISERDFLETFGVSVYSIYGDCLRKHERAGLLSIDNGNIRLSDEGVYLSNIVFCDFLP